MIDTERRSPPAQRERLARRNNTIGLIAAEIVSATTLMAPTEREHPHQLRTRSLPPFHSRCLYGAALRPGRVPPHRRGPASALFEGPRPKVRDASHDRSLVFPDRNRPSADDRTLVYQKGVYVFHLLRETLGEALCDDTETASLTCNQDSERQSSLQRQSLRGHQVLKFCGE